MKKHATVYNVYRWFEPEYIEETGVDRAYDHMGVFTKEDYAIKAVELMKQDDKNCGCETYYTYDIQDIPFDSFCTDTSEYFIDF